MSHVQSKVLPLLPKLATPYDANDAVNNDNRNGARPPRDLLVKAKTGTGKTLAFLVPAVEARLRALDDHAKRALEDSGLVTDRALEARARKRFGFEKVGTLVISPTRELATQIANEALRLTAHHDGFEVQLLVGGESRRGQLRSWKGRKDLVVATPGRLRDLLGEREVESALKHTQTVGFFLLVLNARTDERCFVARAGRG
jgi:ATP-dependent RNA helicase MSS116